MYEFASVSSPSARLGHRDISVVLPTFNEAANVGPILEKIEAALEGVAWEVIFVDDDSRDGTASEVFRAAADHPNVRLVRRIGRRGLSSAVIEGALASMAPVVAVMDADMQHDETLLPKMLELLRGGEYDLVVGTRYIEGGASDGLSGYRKAISQFATRLAQIVTRTKLSDPMSGFFMITRDAFESAVRRLSGQGFKILLDIVASSERPLRVAELPFEFRARQFGESKLDSAVATEYLMLLLDKTIGRYVPVRFLMFVLVGGLGLTIHMAVLSVTYGLSHVPFMASQLLATVCAMTFNFFLNNYLTYRDIRLKGAAQLVTGLLSFYAVCSVGAVANVGIANYMFTERYSWWLAGVAGVLVGAVWNFAASSIFTWKTKK
ncbi:MAG: glycosyltransferase family 2 protein [Caulobacterales bacterium]